MKLRQEDRQPGFLERIWIALWTLTPPGFRRMSLLSSLYARFAECDEDDRNRLGQMNQEMGLTRDVRCMMFSVLLAPLLWKRVLPICKVDECNTERYATRIFNNIPCWLKYGEDEEVTKDIGALLRYCLKERNDLQPT